MYLPITGQLSIIFVSCKEPHSSIFREDSLTDSTLSTRRAFRQSIEFIDGTVEGAGVGVKHSPTCILSRVAIAKLH